MRTILYVGNLASHADPRELAHLFGPHGTVTKAEVFEAADLLHRRGGFGIVEMSSHEEAAAAIAALDGVDIPGGQLPAGTLSVRWAAPHELDGAHVPRLFGTMNMINDAEERS